MAATSRTIFEPRIIYNHRLLQGLHTILQQLRSDCQQMATLEVNLTTFQKNLTENFFDLDEDLAQSIKMRTLPLKCQNKMIEIIKEFEIYIHEQEFVWETNPHLFNEKIAKIVNLLKNDIIENIKQIDNNLELIIERVGGQEDLQAQAVTQTLAALNILKLRNDNILEALEKRHAWFTALLNERTAKPAAQDPKSEIKVRMDVPMMPQPAAASSVANGHLSTKTPIQAKDEQPALRADDEVKGEDEQDEIMETLQAILNLVQEEQISFVKLSSDLLVFDGQTRTISLFAPSVISGYIGDVICFIAGALQDINKDLSHPIGYYNSQLMDKNKKISLSSHLRKISDMISTLLEKVDTLSTQREGIARLTAMLEDHHLQNKTDLIKKMQQKMEELLGEEGRVDQLRKNITQLREHMLTAIATLIDDPAKDAKPAKPLLLSQSSSASTPKDQAYKANAVNGSKP